MQLLDEIAILWVIMFGFGLWFPRTALPHRWSRQQFQWCCLGVSTVCTGLAAIQLSTNALHCTGPMMVHLSQPVVNAFILLTLGVPALVVLLSELRAEQEGRVVSLGRRTVALWGLAVTCWVQDRAFCAWWADLGFPYLHAAWHILIFLASYNAIVLFAYFEVKNNQSGRAVPVLRYYPTDWFQLGVPYVHIAGRHAASKTSTKKVHLI